MEQSKLESLIETTINTIIGLLVSLIAWPIAAALNDMPYTHGQYLGIVIFFTLISVARGYIVRRWFNHRIKKRASLIASKLGHHQQGAEL